MNLTVAQRTALERLAEEHPGAQVVERRTGAATYSATYYGGPAEIPIVQLPDGGLRAVRPTGRVIVLPRPSEYPRPSG